MSVNCIREGIYFIQVPPLEDLCSVTVKVPALQNPNGSPYQPHVIRCRELIFTEPDIIASPLLGIDRAVQIIMQQTFYKSGRLQSRFQKIGIEMQKPRRVLPHEFQACLNYTITAKTAPVWNKAGDMMIEGRDFVTSSEKLHAVRFELSVTESQVYMSLRASSVRMPPLKVHDLGIGPSVMNEFVSQRPHGKIEEFSIFSKWCHILPSLKKGQVVGLSHELPQNSPFSSYNVMKRYWKNTYGYRLPETDDDILYCQVYFKPIGEKFFTYPACCIRPRDPMYCPRTDSSAVLDSFLHNFQVKVPSVCGAKASIHPQPQFTNPRLSLTHEVNSCQNTQNLTRECPAISNESSEQTKQARISSLAESKSTLVRGQMVEVPDSMRSVKKPPAMSLDLMHFKMAEAVSESDFTSRTPAKTVPHVKIPSNNSSVLAPPKSMNKIVPVFKPRRPRSSSICPSTVGKTKAVPVFRPAVHRFAHTPKKASSDISKAPVDPSKSADIRQMELLMSPDADFAPQSRQPVRKNVHLTPLGSSKMQISRFRLDENLTRACPRRPSSDVGSNPRAIHMENPALGHLGTTPTSDGLGPSHMPPALLGSSGIRPQLKNTSSKRPMQIYEHTAQGITPVKKPRAKPKVVEGLDVEYLVRTRQTGQVNSATLLSWLQERGVQCKAREKKADLINKILSFLSVATSEV